MASSDEQCAWCTAFLSSLAGVGIAAAFALLCWAIRLVVRRCINRRRLPDANTRADAEADLSGKPCDTLPFADNPPITTVTTMPGHAVSDMDRDIKFGIANWQEIQDHEAAVHWKHTG
jgi:hypothetical protein